VVCLKDAIGIWLADHGKPTKSLCQDNQLVTCLNLNVLSLNCLIGPKHLILLHSSRETSVTETRPFLKRIKHKTNWYAWLVSMVVVVVMVVEGMQLLRLLMPLYQLHHIFCLLSSVVMCVITALPHTHTHTHARISVHSHIFTSCCLVVASDGRRSAFPGFPNCPRTQLPASNSNSSQQLRTSSSLVNSITHQPTH
jgi:hypothetical protein